ncbi:hypothetical protein D7V91_07820 [bacterium 1xD42-67]|nr:hypothetical protein D7V91_07820 [bacterium 1xD42-67]
MKRKIDLWTKGQKDTVNSARPRGRSLVSQPRRSLVQVYFAKRGMDLAYYNDRFDLQVGDIVYVDGKLEGLQGRVTAVDYSFKIKLSDYKRVIAVADTRISGELHMVGSHLVSFDPQTIPYEKIVTWFKAPDKEDDIYVSGSDDHGFRLDDLSGMGANSAVAERGRRYYLEDRVVYLCIDHGHGRGIVEGTSPYEIEFDHSGGEIKNLTCSCYCSYPCKHTVAAMLQLRELLEQLEGRDGFDRDEDGYAAAISQKAFFSFVMGGKTAGSFVFR